MGKYRVQVDVNGKYEAIQIADLIRNSTVDTDYDDTVEVLVIPLENDSDGL